MWFWGNSLLSFAPVAKKLDKYSCKKGIFSGGCLESQVSSCLPSGDISFSEMVNGWDAYMSPWCPQLLAVSHTAHELSFILSSHSCDFKGRDQQYLSLVALGRAIKLSLTY